MGIFSVFIFLFIYFILCSLFFFFLFASRAQICFFLLILVAFLNEIKTGEEF